ncbi:hypothetical protein ACFOLJ_18115 [Rugamonas sp. CCM 8940]|uniref:hypothetical protein n=1 Tax=Rugamonas sp. CCM 8940 TaxID=2765359 RepID=UPI0018F34B69|nr:hypothetical protein [Rugamonas sp. CCM 8940]MBJ7313429.1 hypothetical protein [Rugamonas sp. CCM 8940]
MSIVASIDLLTAGRGAATTPAGAGGGVFYVAESAQLLPKRRRKRKNPREKFRHNISAWLLIVSKQC